MPRLNIHDPYDRRIRDDLEAISPGLSDSFSRVTTLAEADAGRAIRCVLRHACVATHARAIVLGREYLSEADRDWLVAHIERIAADCLDMNDEWDYSRLLEIYKMLDVDLLARLVRTGLRSSDPGVIDAARSLRR